MNKALSQEMPFCLNVPQVAKLMGINKNRAYELVHREDFPSLKAGNRIIVPRDQFLAWLDKEAGRPLA